MSLPAIVIPAWNRPDCLKRLLGSLSEAWFPEGEIPLIFSLEGGHSAEVAKVAEEFTWPHGPKELIRREERLGLKKHILACGDLTNRFGAVLLLEDDLWAGPQFYAFAQQALAAYGAAPKIAGISLYSYEISECRFLPFRPIADGNSVYFQQFAGSWGQVWTREHWAPFRKWYEENERLQEGEKLPQYLWEWSETSWKRHFIRYLLATDKYFVFPRLSQTLNFGEPGTNADTPGLWQVPVALEAEPLRLPSFADSKSIYDVYFEPTPATLRRWNQELAEYDFCVDLYGQRDPDFLNSEYVLTTREGGEPALQFGREMFPMSLNVIEKVEGNQIRLIKTADLDPIHLPLHHYYYVTRSIDEFIYRDRIEEVANEMAEVWAEERSEHKAIEKAYPIAEKMAAEQAKVLAEEIAEDRAREKLKTWQERQEFGEKYPKILTVIAGDGINAETERNKITEAAYPHREICLLGAEVPANGRDEHERLMIHGLPIAENALMKGLKEALSASSAEIVGLLPPETQYLPGSLNQVARIFRKFPEINWVMFRKEGVHGRTGDLRWTQERFASASLGEMQRLIRPETIFWDRKFLLGVLESIPANGPFSLLAEAALAQQNLFAADLPVLGPGTKGWQTGKPKRAGRFAISTGKKLWNGLFRSFFLNNTPLLRAFYPEANFVADVIRFDEKTGDFWRNKY